ncbi:winged helix-turn-helix transcriptional regulator [Acidisoma cellulosilyticum]|nr:helix-turn-helix domain-containing protein [Acidisoma cellulosilyticum]
MKRKSLEGDICAIARTLDVIGDWWSLLIVRDALGGLRRFNEFQQHLGVAKNILTTRLKALVEHGILQLAPASDGTAYYEYVPTPKGRALLPALVALAQWGDDYLFDADEACNVPVDSASEKPLKKLKLVAQDGRELAVTDVRMTRTA